MGGLHWQETEWVREAWSRKPVRLAAAATLGASLLTIPAFVPSAGALMSASFFGSVEPRQKPAAQTAEPPLAEEARPRVVDWTLHSPHGEARLPGGEKSSVFHISIDGADPVFRRDMASLEELGLVDGIATAELPVLATFGNDDAWLKPFVGGSLALTQSYADAGHNRLIVITDPDAVIKFQGTAGLSLLSSGPSELQVFYRYIKFTDPSLRPSASLLALTDTLTTRQRQHEVMIGWRLKL